MQNEVKQRITKAMLAGKDKDAMLALRIPAKLKFQFMQYCATQAVRPSDYLRALIELSVAKDGR